MAESIWEGTGVVGAVADGGTMAEKPSSSPVICENDIERPILYGEDTGRSSGRWRTHLDTSLARRWLGDGAGHGGADGGSLQ